MSLKEVTMYTIVCDVCGKEAFEGDEFVAWSDPEGALETYAAIGDWSTHPSGQLHRCEDHNPYCERCGSNAGEFCGERDYLCPNCWALAEAPVRVNTDPSITT